MVLSVQLVFLLERADRQTDATEIPTHAGVGNYAGRPVRQCSGCWAADASADKRQRTSPAGGRADAAAGLNYRSSFDRYTERAG